MKKLLGDKKILFIYHLLHPVHKKLMKTVTNDFIHKSEKISKNYDIYVFEAEYANATFHKYTRKIGKDKKIVSFIADPRLYYLNKGVMFNIKKNLLSKYPLWRKILMKILIKKLDGVICMGKLTYDYFRLLNKDCPAVYVEGFISNERFEKLKKIKPIFNEPNLLFIGHGPDYNCKGIDLMIDSFKLVREKIPDAKLFILGSMWNMKDSWNVDGVFFEGEKNIIPYIKRCSLGIHMGRGEAFGVNIPEMMLAGIPVIVSDKTGAKEVVKKFDPNFISELDKKEVAKKIISFLSLPLHKKKILGRKASLVARYYNEKKQSAEFKRKFDTLIENMYS